MVLPFNFQKEHKRTGCEDAPPVSTSEYAIVCDGLGGAGLTRHTLPQQDAAEKPLVRTSAYLGSRVVSDCVEAYYQEKGPELMESLKDFEKSGDTISVFLGELKERLVETMAEKMEEYCIDPNLPKKSKTLKIFPTTLASVLVREKANTVSVLAVWAGDSRVYYLSPEKGLQMLSMDDAKGAEDTMGSASEMTNTISAGKEFSLNYGVYELPKQGIVFCCSDGCFDYIPSPLQLEWGILYSILRELPKLEEKQIGLESTDFAVNLASSIRDFVYSDIGDDTTMAGMLFNIESSGEIARLYTARMDRVEPETQKISGALQDVRVGEQERNTAKKTCLRYEDGVISALKSAVSDALLSGKPEALARLLTEQPEYKSFQTNKEEIDLQMQKEDQERQTALENELKPLRMNCKKHLIQDAVTRQRTSKKNPKKYRWEPIQQPAPNYSRSSAKFEIQACIQLLEHSEFSKRIAHPGIPEEDWLGNLQSKADALKFLLQVLELKDTYIADMWDQSVSAVLLEENLDYTMPPEEQKALWRNAMADPYDPIPTPLTRELIEEYKFLKDQRTPSEQERSADRLTRLKSAAEKFFYANREQIMDAVFAENTSPAEYLSRYGMASSAEVGAYSSARTAVSQLDEKIQSAQNTVLKIWGNYRGNYQLFLTEIEKGAI